MLLCGSEFDPESPVDLSDIKEIHEGKFIKL